MTPFRAWANLEVYWTVMSAGTEEFAMVEPTPIRILAATGASWRKP